MPRRRVSLVLRGHRRRLERGVLGGDPEEEEEEEEGDGDDNQEEEAEAGAAAQLSPEPSGASELWPASTHWRR